MLEKTIERLAEHLFGALQESDGLSKAEVSSGERKLQRCFPPALTTFYQTVGRHNQFLGVHDRFLMPAECYLDSGALVFCEENQSVVYWGIQESQLEITDPAVMQSSRDDDTWYPDCDRLSTFLTSMLCWQATHSLPTAGSSELTDPLLSRLQANLWSVAGFDPTYDLVALCGDGLAVCCFPEQQVVYVSGSSDERLEQFQEAYDIDLDWL